MTLHDFYATRSAKPARFFSDLRGGNVWDFTREDIEASLMMLETADPKFARTVALAAAAVAHSDERFTRAILEFVRVAADARLLPDEVQAADSERSSEDEFRSLVSGQAKRLSAATKRDEALNLLLSRALQMTYASRLAAEVVILELARALDESPKRTVRADLARVAQLAAAAKTGPAGLRLQLQLALPWISDARKAELQAEDETSRAKALEDSLATTQQELHETVERLSVTSSDLQSARDEIERLKADLVAARHHNAHDLRETRGRVAGALSGRLVELVATIRDALDVDPPRVAVAREKTEVALEELERQLEWLRSSV